MEHDILVDGYNVIKNNPMFRLVEMKSLAEARRVLIQQLKNRYRHASQRVIVVFDGDGAREQISHEDHIRIIFSRHGETADSVIKRLAAEAQQAGQIIDLFSNDGDVRQTVERVGGNVYSTKKLTNQLNAPPSDVALRSLHRQAMRRIYGIDPRYKIEDELEPEQPYRKKKKKSSRRRH